MAAPNDMPHFQYSYSSNTANSALITTTINNINSQSQRVDYHHHSNQEANFSSNFSNLDYVNTATNNNSVVPYNNDGAGVDDIGGGCPAAHVVVRDNGVQPRTVVDKKSKSTAFPLGFRFRPTDWELVRFYLFNKVHGFPLPAVDQIFDTNIYEDSPDSITAKYPSIGGNQWYFFTPRDKRYPQGSRPKRSAGDGFWKVTGRNRIITDGPRGEGLGFRKSLVYYKGKPSSGKKTDWLMYEFWLKHSPVPAKDNANNMRLDDCVLCKIYLKRVAKKSLTPKSSKAGGHSEEDGGIAPNDGETEEDFRQNVVHVFPNCAVVVDTSQYSLAELNRSSQPYPFHAECIGVPSARFSPSLSQLDPTGHISNVSSLQCYNFQSTYLNLPSIPRQSHMQKNNCQQLLDTQAYPSQSYSTEVADATGVGASGGLEGGFRKPENNMGYIPDEFSFPSPLGVPEGDDFPVDGESDYISAPRIPAQKPGNSQLDPFIIISP